MKELFTSPSIKEKKPTETKQCKSSGCIPGIFFFFHRHHRDRSRKRLPSGKKEKDKNKNAKRTATPPAVVTREKKDKKRAGSPDVVRPGTGPKASYETPRSPTLAAAIRRPDTSTSGSSPRRSPALVARLMGLEELPVSPSSSAAEKRRKLLGALEKCDEDLKALKRIIDVIRVSERSDLDKSGLMAMEKKRCGEERSPVSVLNAVTSPTNVVKYQPFQVIRRGDNGNQKQNPTTTTNKNLGFGFIQRAAMEGRPTNTKLDHLANSRFSDGRLRVSKCSKAMAANVDEVCRDGVAEEKWELGQVAVALECEIYWDLVEEMVGDMGGGWSPMRRSLPSGACRRRLCF